MDRPLARGIELDDILAHYGIKGMRWGIRRSNPSEAPSRSDDSANVKATKAKIKAGGVKALSNKELKDYLERMDLEKRYKKAKPGARGEAEMFVKDMLLQIGKEETKKYVSRQLAQVLVRR